MLLFIACQYNTLISLAMPSREAVSSKESAKKTSTVDVEPIVALAYGDKRVWEEVHDRVTGQRSFFCRSTKEVRRTKPPGYDTQVLERAKRLTQQRSKLVLAPP